MNSPFRSIWPVILIGVLALGLLEFMKKSPADVMTAPDPTLLTEARARISAVEGIDGLLATCPADIWQTRTGGSMPLVMGAQSWTEETCPRDLGGCVEACLTGSSGAACRQVARTIDLFDMPDGDLDRRKANALSCALGYPSGCTNRAAEIRNASITVDPMSGRPEAERQLCTYRSFDIACDADNPWGCAMLGQAFRLGEGVEADPQEARRKYRKACTLHPGPERERTEYAPCRFARSGLAAMDGAEPDLTE